jgi:hypothetical protein
MLLADLPRSMTVKIVYYMYELKAQVWFLHDHF